MRVQRAQAEGKEGWVRAPAHSQLVTSADQSHGLTQAIRNLHHTHGNRFVQRLLHSGLLQAKLMVSQPGDPAEQEAERVAEVVMRPSDPGVTGTAAVDGQAGSSEIQRICSTCEEKMHRQAMEDEEEEMALQPATAAPGQPTVVRPELEAQVQAQRARGQPLPTSVRTFFEPRFERDFSQVRVHADAHAAESAQAVQALAYTVGSDIVFGAGQYAPATTAGQRLLAHELTHVVQQGASQTLSPKRAFTSPRPPQPTALPAAIQPLTIAAQRVSLQTVARQVEAEETVAKLAVEDKEPMDTDTAEALG